MNLKILIVLFIALIMIIYLLKNWIDVKKINKYENRFSLFSYGLNQDENLKYYERLKYYFIKHLKIISVVLEKFKFFRKYSNKYKKFENSKSDMKKIDYVSLKFFITLVFLFLVIIFNIFKILPYSLILSLFIIIFGFYFLDIILLLKYHKIKIDLESDLYKAIQIINTNLKTKSITTSILEVTKKLDGPIKNEFKIIYKELKRGISVDEAFKKFYKKYKIKMVKNIYLLIIMTDDNNSNYQELFSNLELRLKEQEKFVDSMSLSKVTTLILFLFFSILPILMIIIILNIKKTYFDAFFNTYAGIISLIVLLAIYIVYIREMIKLIGDDDYE